MAPASIVIDDADPDCADARVLVGELTQALAAISGDGGTASFEPADVRTARACFVLARDARGVLLGCAALRPLDADTGEVKRMYARPGTRGVGAALLAHLERRAQALTYTALVLETRRINTRAVAFYARHGYQRIANYGKYVGRANAICLGKTLHAPAPLAQTD